MDEPTTQAEPLAPEEVAELRRNGNLWYRRASIDRLLATLDWERAAARALPGVDALAEHRPEMFDLIDEAGRCLCGWRPELLASAGPVEQWWLHVTSAIALLPPDSRAERLEAALRIIAATPESAPNAIPVSARNVARAALAPAAPVQEDSHE